MSSKALPDSSSPTTVSPREAFLREQQIVEASEKLNRTEKVKKWGLKILVMMTGVIASTLLTAAAAALAAVTHCPSILSEYLDPAAGMGIAFIATMKVLEKIDKYFLLKARLRHASNPPSIDPKRVTQIV